jgi:hypothetical protein
VAEFITSDHTSVLAFMSRRVPITGRTIARITGRRMDRLTVTADMATADMATAPIITRSADFIFLRVWESAGIGSFDVCITPRNLAGRV